MLNVSVHVNSDARPLLLRDPLGGGHSLDLPCGKKSGHLSLRHLSPGRELRWPQEVPSPSFVGFGVGGRWCLALTFPIITAGRPHTGVGGENGEAKIELRDSEQTPRALLS